MGILGRLTEARRKQVLVRRFGKEWGQRLFDLNLLPDVPFQVTPDNHLIHPPTALRVGMSDTGADAALEGCQNWLDWGARRGLTFHSRENNVFAEIDGIRFFLPQRNDYFTLSEVFREELYRFQAEGSYAFMDIGANVGMASLYFAKNHDGPVVAYELVPDTANHAEMNFSLNPDLKPRIEFVRAGLGRREEKMTIRFDPHSSACNSVYNQTGTLEAEVTLLDAATELTRVAGANPDRKICVKLDAEGAEYDILDRWAETDCLSKIDLLLLEWHVVAGRTVEELRQILRSNGFQWFERVHATEPVGFVTAWR
jgi:FkbM family methyltransferase